MTIVTNDAFALETPYSPGASDFQANIDYARMRVERLRRAQAALKRHNIPAALLMRLENMRYALSVRGHVFVPGLSYALIFAEREPILYETGTMIQQQQMYCTWLKPENVRLAYCWLDSICGTAAAQDEAKKFAQSLARDLKANGVASGRIGSDGLDEIGRSALRAEGFELVNAQPVLMEARRTKTPDEVACMETAIAICNAGFMAFANDFKPGMRERDGGALIHAALYRAGAESAAGGPRSKYNTFDVYHESNTDRIVDPGDLVTVNLCSTKFSGYRVCIYRSFIVGRKPNQKEKDWYKKCRDRVYGVIDAIKPGATTADAARALVPASNWGYQDPEATLVAEVGHGIGMTYEEPVISPIWSPQHPQIFEPGMIIAVECREGEVGYGGVRLEEMVLVTKTGHRILTTWPAEEIVPVACIV